MRRACGNVGAVDGKVGRNGCGTGEWVGVVGTIASLTSLTAIEEIAW